MPLHFLIGRLGSSQLAVTLISAGASGALVLLASCWDRKRPPSDVNHCFPVRFLRLLRRSVLVTAGVGLAAYAAQILLARESLGWGGWPEWIEFLSGSALVLSLLHRWPESLIFDREGVVLHGDRSSRLRWEDLSHIRKYSLRGKRGIVIHTVCGKQLHVPDEEYECEKVQTALTAAHRAPVQSPGIALNLPMPFIRIRPTPPRR